MLMRPAARIGNDLRCVRPKKEGWAQLENQLNLTELENQLLQLVTV